MGRRSKSRSLISTHNLLIILCLILIAVSVHMLFSEEDEEMIVGQAKEQTQAQNQSQTENQTKPTANNQVTQKEDVKVVENGNTGNQIKKT